MTSVHLLATGAALAGLAACGRAAPLTAPTAADDPFAAPAVEATPLHGLNTAAAERAWTFDPVGQVAYLERAAPDGRAPRIVSAEWFEGAWQTAADAPWSDGYRERAPFFHVARDRLYFASDRPRTGRDPQPDLDLWFVDRDGDGWTEPRRLTGGVNDRRELGFASIARDGALVAAVADERGPSLVEAQPTADGYGAPAPVVLPDPPAGTLGAPLIAPDRSFLLFTVEPGPFGGADLMVAFRTVDGGWGPSAPLLGVNTEADETAPALSPDERRLIFASDRPGGAGATDLYQVELAVALPAR